MVGVRSSRGCKACRRKKRGCDLSKPICGQCQKIGAKCAYEDRSYTFVAPQERATRTHSPATINQPSFLLTDRRQQLETTFWEAYLPSSESPQDTAFTHTVIATWIPT
ncbi:MAG: Zn(II)2Cys6 transcription factor, partial [Sphingobacteriales bacterium]